MTCFYRASTILLLLVFGSPDVTYADSAVQTDWSGGAGVPGPVTVWSDQFLLCTSIEWDSIPGVIVLPGVIAECKVVEYFAGARCVYSEDVDGDGDMDILGAAYQADDITWWENANSSGTSWTEHAVDGSFDGARTVYSEDIDGDGDMDVLGAAWDADDITWWENIDGSGTSWTEHAVDGSFYGASSVYSEDIDGDGDMDILGAAQQVSDIAWWENTDGAGASWLKHNVDVSFGGAYSVYSEDIDGDGDMDILGAAFVADDIAWWENANGSGTSWTEHAVDGSFNGARSVYSEDIDGDGDMDILGAAYVADDITWWENANGSGTSWTEHTVAGSFDGARSVCSKDIDGDGDMDILGAAYQGNEITWWENTDGSGESWTEHNVDFTFYGASSVYSEDMDGDGEMDILGAASITGEITWWGFAAHSPAGSLESSVLDTQVNPDWDYLEWNSQTPAGTSVSIQVRASDDHSVMGAWSDTLQAPTLLEGILADGDRYIQYRAILETSDQDTTPALFDVMLTWDPMGIGGTGDPAVMALLPFSPNPASVPAVRFSLPEPASVAISVLDLSGRLVYEIHGNDYSTGYHTTKLDRLSPGIYFCRMISGDFTAAQRFVVIE